MPSSDPNWTIKSVVVTWDAQGTGSAKATKEATIGPLCSITMTGDTFYPRDMRLLAQIADAVKRYRE